MADTTIDDAVSSLAELRIDSLVGPVAGLTVKKELDSVAAFSAELCTGLKLQQGFDPETTCPGSAAR